jgi:hypothetical protein
MIFFETTCNNKKNHANEMNATLVELIYLFQKTINYFATINFL